VSAPQLPSDRRFGLLFVVVWALLAAYGAHKAWLNLVVSIFVAASVTFALATLFVPKALRPLNFAWFKLGELMGKIVSPIVLGIIFYLLITPVGLVGRLFGRDELKLKRGAEKSYWIKRDPPGPSGESFKNQY
jgi:Saxitoxin biosynthesis operon protein SxtJ